MENLLNTGLIALNRDEEILTKTLLGINRYVKMVQNRDILKSKLNDIVKRIVDKENVAVLNAEVEKEPVAADKMNQKGISIVRLITLK